MKRTACPGAHVAVKAVGLIAAVTALLSCSNNPYPAADDDLKILYSVYGEAPKTLDPAVSYNVSSSRIVSAICETLLEYHYLKRPYQLIPGLAEAIPEPVEREDGTVSYTFQLREGVMFQDDPSFALGEEGRKTRRVVADDYLFALKRLGDPAINSPVAHIFSKVVGLHDFGEALSERRQDEAFAVLAAHEQYAALGPVEGLVRHGDYAFEVILDAPYPQLVYWFAMPFTTAVPWEALVYYDGNEGRPRFADHPVGAGPYRMTHYDKQFRIVLERNPNWYGVMFPEWKAPGAVYPSEGEEDDVERGLVGSGLAGQPLPFLDRIEFRREKESIPVFNKFLQGYYDKSGINKESFDKVMDGNQLSEDMAEMGIQLERVVDMAIFYIAFNYDDEVVGSPAGERGRKLRQAMSLAIDAEEYIELFLNGRGLPAQSVLPPGLFGYDPEYKNRYREPDLPRARALLEEAGYANGIDPETGAPLKLRFDTYATSSSQLIPIRYLTDSWRKIGLDVEVEGTTYNKFQEKVDNQVHQIIQWGWVADYPDPENFLFLLESGMAAQGGPNHAIFRSAEYDALFEAMKSRPNDEVRAETIRQMLTLLEEERVWIELMYRESFVLFHDWVSHYKPPGFEFSTLKYQDIDAGARKVWRREHNQPVLWPAYVLMVVAILVIAPGIVTLIRERQ